MVSLCRIAKSLGISPIKIQPFEDCLIRKTLRLGWYCLSSLIICIGVLNFGSMVLGQKPPRHKPPDKTPWTKTPFAKTPQTKHSFQKFYNFCFKNELWKINLNLVFSSKIRKAWVYKVVHGWHNHRFGWHKAGSFVVLKKIVSSHTDVVGEATEILQSVPVVVVLDDILYSSVAVMIATTWRLWLMASSSL